LALVARLDNKVKLVLLVLMGNLDQQVLLVNTVPQVLLVNLVQLVLLVSKAVQVQQEAVQQVLLAHKVYEALPV
jgi:hypothetical protein